ncbi:MAG: PhoX family protein [Trichloromonadaceae bacterium]
MKAKTRTLALSAVLSTLIFTQGADAGQSNLRSVEFIGMPAPATAQEKADIYTKAQMKITDQRGKTQTIELKYHQLMATTDMIQGKVVGGLYDSFDAPLTDMDGQLASDAPDGTSLMEIPGMRAVNPAKNRALALVTQYEYKELAPNDGVSSGSFWSKLPALMSLARLEQNKTTGALEVADYNPISFSGVNGGWIHCGSTLSNWNTHLGSEEYEPDAKTREGLPKASDSDDGTDIDSFSKYYFGDSTKANPYHFGLVPEVRVRRDGSTLVVKHYATGRFAREMMEMAADNRSAIGGDDGKNTILSMFVADKKQDLSAGTLYAAKVTQLSADNGGSFELQWIKLGHASDGEIQALVDGGIKFNDIFDVSLTDPGDPSYTKVVTAAAKTRHGPGGRLPGDPPLRRFARRHQRILQNGVHRFQPAGPQVLPHHLAGGSRHGRHQRRHPGSPQ